MWTYFFDEYCMQKLHYLIWIQGNEMKKDSQFPGGTWMQLMWKPQLWHNDVVICVDLEVYAYCQAALLRKLACS